MKIHTAFFSTCNKAVFVKKYTEDLLLAIMQTSKKAKTIVLNQITLQSEIKRNKDLPNEISCALSCRELDKNLLLDRVSPTPYHTKHA